MYWKKDLKKLLVWDVNLDNLLVIKNDNHAVLLIYVNPREKFIIGYF